MQSLIKKTPSSSDWQLIVNNNVAKKAVVDKGKIRHTAGRNIPPIRVVSRDLGGESIYHQRNPPIGTKPSRFSFEAIRRDAAINRMPLEVLDLVL